MCIIFNGLSAWVPLVLLVLNERESQKSSKVEIIEQSLILVCKFALLHLFLLTIKFSKKCVEVTSEDHTRKTPEDI